MRIIRRADLTEAAWRNGGGVTREIMVSQEGDALLWRLSMADLVAEGPFSDFSGFARVLTVIEGGPIWLEAPDRRLIAARGVPVSFDGGMAVRSVLPAGPASVINLISDPHRVSAEVTPLRGPQTVRLAPRDGTRLAVICLTGTVAVGQPALLKGDTALVDAESVDMSLGAGGSVLRIALASVSP